MPLGAELARRGHEVVGVRRSHDGDALLQSAGITPAVADVTRASSLRALPGPFDWVVNTISSGKGGAAEYLALFVEGTQNVLDWLDPQQPRRYVQFGSTSVYGQTDGSWVDESSPTAPASETSRALLQMEQLLLQAAHTRSFPAVILRVAGIYGPGRAHMLKQMLNGEARMTGEAARWLNMVHLEDVVSSTAAALEHGSAGGIFNVADDAPVAQRDFWEWLATRLDKPLPPPAGLDAGRKRGVTNKRVSNARLKSILGCTLRYPTFREGYAQEISRLGLVLKP